MSGALLVSPVEHDELTRAEARVLTGEARAALRSALQWASRAVELVERAWAMRADVALGYPTWEAYCATEFAGLRDIRIPVPTRVEIVEALTEAGMSTRKVGAVLSIAEQTVRADIARARAPHAAAGVLAAPPAPSGPPQAVAAPLLRRATPVAAAGERRPTQVELVLAELAAAGSKGLTWIELGQALGLHHGSASAVLSKLDRRGLVERTTTYRQACAAYVLTRRTLAA